MAIEKQIKINDNYITLGQLLKMADLISSGGEAKYFLLNNKVVVNGELEDRRGRKLYKDDLIEIDSSIYKICQ